MKSYKRDSYYRIGFVPKNDPIFIVFFTKIEVFKGEGNENKAKKLPIRVRIYDFSPIK